MYFLILNRTPESSRVRLIRNRLPKKFYITFLTLDDIVFIFMILKNPFSLSVKINSH